MLTGTADPERLGQGAPRVPSLTAEGLALPGAEQLGVVVEIESGPMLELLPPALHPTLPPLARIVATRCPESPVGPFAMAELRVECRSGVRPRAFLLGGFVDRPEAGELLAARFGYRLGRGEVELSAGYCDAEVRVRAGGQDVLHAVARDLVPLGSADVQPVASLHLAETERGLRLLQVDAGGEVRRAERGRPELAAFDGAAFGGPRVRPSHPVSAALLRLDLRLPPLRFVCRPDVMAFVGTEPAAARA